jgi:hypothetical protein
MVVAHQDEDGRSNWSLALSLSIVDVVDDNDEQDMPADEFADDNDCDDHTEDAIVTMRTKKVKIDWWICAFFLYPTVSMMSISFSMCIFVCLFSGLAVDVGG